MKKARPQEDEAATDVGGRNCDCNSSVSKSEGSYSNGLGVLRMSESNKKRTCALYFSNSGVQKTGHCRYSNCHDQI